MAVMTKRSEPPTGFYFHPYDFEEPSSFFLNSKQDGEDLGQWNPELVEKPAAAKQATSLILRSSKKEVKGSL